jgi:hypothetical protein
MSNMKKSLDTFEPAKPFGLDLLTGEFSWHKSSIPTFLH